MTASMTPTASAISAVAQATSAGTFAALPQPMDLLASGVPLSLIIDLLDDRGPNSERILEAEPGDVGWLREPHRS